MDPKQTNPNEQTTQQIGDIRRTALLRYMAILFSVAFLLVLGSLVVQMHKSQATISELNATSSSALSNAEQLQEQNRALQDDKRELERENQTLEHDNQTLEQQLTVAQDQVRELDQKLQALQEQQQEQQTENQTRTELQLELERTKEAYEALMTALESTDHEGDVTFSRAMETLRRLNEYLGPAARERWEALAEEN